MVLGQTIITTAGDEVAEGTLWYNYMNNICSFILDQTLIFRLRYLINKYIDNIKL